MELLLFFLIFMAPEIIILLNGELLVLLSNKLFQMGLISSEVKMEEDTLFAISFLVFIGIIVSFVVYRIIRFVLDKLISHK